MSRSHLFIIVKLALLALSCKTSQNQPVDGRSQEVKKETQTVVDFLIHRDESGVDTLKVVSKIQDWKVESLFFRGRGDRNFVKLEVVSIDSTEYRTKLKRSDNQEEMVFFSTFDLGTTKFYPDGRQEEYFREVLCVSPTGEKITTSGGPFFVPFFYAENQNAEFVAVMADPVSGSKLKGDTTVIEVKIPGKGVGSISALPYKENDRTTRFILDINGKKTFFQSQN